MVDAVSAVSVQNAILRSGSQGGVSAHLPEAPQNAEVVSSHIRVDNIQNVTILEYVSSKTGEVVQQYPTQAQINAFKRAESLLSRRQAETARQVNEQYSYGGRESSAPLPAPHQISAPAPDPTVPAPVDNPASATTSFLV